MRRAGIGERVGQAGLLRLLSGQGAAERVVEGGRVGDRTGGAVVGADPEFACTLPQGTDVGGTDLPAGAGEDAYGGAARHRVGDQAQHRNDVGHLRRVQQTTEAHHLHGEAPRPQFLRDRGGVGVASHQHGRGGRLRAVDAGRLVLLGDPVGHPGALGLHGVEKASRTSPGTAAGRARSLLTSTPLSRNGSEIMLASSRASGGFRQLVSNSSLGAGVPSASGKSVAKRGRLAADAPRQP